VRCGADNSCSHRGFADIAGMAADYHQHRLFRRREPLRELFQLLFELSQLPAHFG
jgi:hypothetical protein